MIPEGEEYIFNEVPSYPTPFCYPLKFHIATVPHSNVIYARLSVRLCVFFFSFFFFFLMLGSGFDFPVKFYVLVHPLLRFVLWGMGVAVSLNLKTSFLMVM